MILKTWMMIVLLAAAAMLHAAEPVNINEADAETLATSIKGVGIKRAEAIVAYREQHGPFRSVDELVEVQGIGEKLLERSRDMLTVRDGES